jgi:hypothetical protein
MPILLEEPFGIVMADAVEFATTVQRVHRRVMSEVVKNGETFVVEDLDALAQAVVSLPAIDGRASQALIEARYRGRAIIEANSLVDIGRLTQRTGEE